MTNHSAKISAYCIFNKDSLISSAAQFSFDDLEPASNSRELLRSIYYKLEIAYSKFHKMDILSKAGIIATDYLINSCNDKPGIDTALVLANKSSSLQTDLDYYNSVKEEKTSPSLFVYTLPNIVAGEICIRNNFKGENAFLIFECIDLDSLFIQSENLIKLNKADQVIAGWVEQFEDSFDVCLFLVEEKQRSSISLQELKENYRSHGAK